MSAPSVPDGRLDREARAGTAVETRGLTKHYGAVRALTDVDVTIRTGEVYGLVGRNGAGKTTLMRLLLGLVRPTAGTARVLGRDAAAGTSDVGALVESPALYPHLSGRNNLRLLARYCGASDADVRAALDQVGMGARAGSRFSTYSLGMRQRMGVAAALLGEPRLLVLDEPTNGLDPIAMTEMRELIGALRRRGHTVLLSSHLLDEVEQVCDRIGVLADGRLVAEGTIAEIHALADGPARLVVTAQPVDTALAVLRRHPGTGEVRRDGERLEVELGAAAPAEITGALVRAGVEVSDVHVRRRSLQDVFAGLTESDAGVGAA